MGTYIPMEDRQRNDNAATMLYLRDPLPNNSQSQPPLLPGGLVYMNFSSSAATAALPLTDAYSDSQVLLNFGGGRDGHLMDGGNSSVVHGLQGQGLSLSLATNVMQMAPVQYPSGVASILRGRNGMISGDQGRTRTMSFENEDGFHCQQPREGDYALSSGRGSCSDAMHDVLPAYGMPNSKYLKAAQELLDEVVNVKQAVRKEGMTDAAAVDGEGESKDSANELSVAEKHELQNKLTKLLSMLDEVDRRYQQYHHQMQTVVSSFDAVAGSGASRPYTSLARQTISRHFRCLRDAINNQIQAARKPLGEDDASSNNKGIGISRLRYVDQQLRQQRALQQLGLIQHHTWRPQRGLPESSVSILRAWLFEHFLHPYPKDSDKIMLARQTGLTRSQVSNWFINARVRLWKPMVEEMYKEEASDATTTPSEENETAANQMTEMIGPGSSNIQIRVEKQDGMMGSSTGGVSLTLGLQQEQEGSHSQEQEVPLRDTDMYNANATAAEFDCMDSGTGTRPRRFVSSLLPSFS